MALWKDYKVLFASDEEDVKELFTQLDTIFTGIDEAAITEIKNIYSLLNDEQKNDFYVKINALTVGVDYMSINTLAANYNVAHEYAKKACFDVGLALDKNIIALREAVTVASSLIGCSLIALQNRSGLNERDNSALITYLTDICCALSKTVTVTQKDFLEKINPVNVIPLSKTGLETCIYKLKTAYEELNTLCDVNYVPPSNTITKNSALQHSIKLLNAPLDDTGALGELLATCKKKIILKLLKELLKKNTPAAIKACANCYIVYNIPREDIVSLLQEICNSTEKYTELLKDFSEAEQAKEAFAEPPNAIVKIINKELFFMKKLFLFLKGTRSASSAVFPNTSPFLQYCLNEMIVENVPEYAEKMSLYESVKEKAKAYQQEVYINEATALDIKQPSVGKYFNKPYDPKAYARAPIKREDMNGREKMLRDKFKARLKDSVVQSLK
uniref:Uncharacterized protein n=1 Tax=Ranid herpesvirus 4 TaxID=2849006 RepID=A0A8F3CIL3_9VIRU|nr:MAG: hypothetical protein [Ranid herpesvirus 4]